MNHTVYLIRHAQSRPSASVAEPDWPLSAHGLNQAMDLVDVLLPLGIECIHSSPYLRCLQTIDPFARRSGLEVKQHAGLHERTISKRWVKSFAALWIRSWDDFDYALPGCESNREAQQRFVSAVHSIVAAAGEETIGICAHGAVIGLLLHALNPSLDRSVAEALTNPDVLKLIVAGDTWHWDCGFKAAGLETVTSASDDTLADQEQR